MSRSIRFTKLGIDVRSAFCWDKQTVSLDAFPFANCIIRILWKVRSRGRMIGRDNYSKLWLNWMVTVAMVDHRVRYISLGEPKLRHVERSDSSHQTGSGPPESTVSYLSWFT